jgi:hypothetical protein
MCVLADTSGDFSYNDRKIDSPRLSAIRFFHAGIAMSVLYVLLTILIGVGRCCRCGVKCTTRVQIVSVLVSTLSGMLIARTAET